VNQNVEIVDGMRMEGLSKADATSISVHDLIPLARQCDNLVFAGNTVGDEMDDSVLQALVRFAAQSDDRRNSNPATTTTTVALILALNSLESAIRETASGGGEAGRAPLLKTMLKQLSDDAPQHIIAALLNCLLLPTALNLRNLLWHGFVGVMSPSKDEIGCPIPILRPWLALVLVLIRQLRSNAKCSPAVMRQQQQQKEPRVSRSLLLQNAHLNSSSYHPLFDVVAHGTALRQEIQAESYQQYPQFANGTLVGASDLSFSQYLGKWLIPKSHLPLWEYCVNEIARWRRQQPPVMILSVILTILIEHSLRLRWCDANHRPEDAIARPGSFYVTLDGHGQKHKHDIVLHPYLLDGPSKRNELVNQLDGNTMALLSDLFISGCGGPNIRASLAHGLWDGDIDRELLDSFQIMPPDMSKGNNSSEDTRRWDMVDVILAAMEQVAVNRAVGKDTRMIPASLRCYRPMFSFTATTAQRLRELRTSLEQLPKQKNKMLLLQTTPIDGTSTPESVSTLTLPLSSVLMRIDRLLIQLQKQSGKAENKSAALCCFTIDDIYAEHELNQKLEPLGATRSLLADISIAASSFCSSLGEVEAFLLEKDSNRSSRNRKKMKRVLGCSSFILDVFFCFLCCLVSS
jgi:hypothetical protein